MSNLQDGMRTGPKWIAYTDNKTNYSVNKLILFIDITWTSAVPAQIMADQNYVPLSTDCVIIRILTFKLRLANPSLYIATVNPTSSCLWVLKSITISNEND